MAWEETWGWASDVGTAADSALAEPRALQAQILQRAAVGGLAMGRFTDRGGTRAQLVMGFAWAALGVALILTALVSSRPRRTGRATPGEPPPRADRITPP
jgi:hypothetical protein